MRTLNSYPISPKLLLSRPSHQIWRNANHNSWDYTAVVYDTVYLAGAVEMKLVFDEWKKLGWASGEEYILDLELGAEVVLGEGSFTIKNFILTAPSSVKLNLQSVKLYAFSAIIKSCLRSKEWCASL